MSYFISVYREHPHLFLQLPHPSLCRWISNWFHHFSIDGHLGLFPTFWYFKCMSLHILPMLFILEVGWINVTSVIFVRYEHILLHRDCLAFSPATWENFASPQSCSQSMWSNLWSFSFQYFNPVLSSLAIHGKQSSLPTSIISTWQDWETVTWIYSRDAGEQSPEWVEEVCAGD